MSSGALDGHTKRQRKGGVKVAEYADLDGVRTWYDDHGEGEPLVRLHLDAVAASDAGIEFEAWGSEALRPPPLRQLVRSAESNTAASRARIRAMGSEAL